MSGGWNPALPDGSDEDLDNGTGPDFDGPYRQYDDAAAWLEDWLLQVVRPRRSVKWCPTWWRHAEARSRITALWLAWETYWGDNDGQSHWWIVHFPPHWEALTSADGIFASCDNGDNCKGDRPPLTVAQLVDPTTELLN